MEFIELLKASPLIAVAFAFIISLLVGSFLNVVIHRVPLMMENDWKAQMAEFIASEKGLDIAPSEPVGQPLSLMKPRSRCPHCAHQITASENIPVLSWLMLGGKCSGCKAPISKRYPAIELTTGLLGALAIWVFGASAAGVAAVIFTWILISLTFIDIDTQLLPDDLTLPLLWLGLVINIFGVFAPLADAVVGAALGYLVLWSIYWLFKLITGKEGMGYGDFKLLAALGAWFGWQKLPAIILLSSLVGAVVGIGLMIAAKRGKEVPIPFGPYLAGAGLLTLYFGPQLGRLFAL